MPDEEHPQPEVKMPSDEEVKKRLALLHKLLKLKASGEPTRDVLGSLGKGVEAASSRLKEVAENRDPEWAEIVGEEASEFKEELLGAAFVVCQAYLAGVVNAALRMKKGLNAKHEVLQLGEKYGRGPYTKVQVIDAFANYYKHRDDWSSGPWNELKGQQARTAESIRSAHAKEGSPLNLETGMRSLGVNDLHTLVPLHSMLMEWSVSVAENTK